MSKEETPKNMLELGENIGKMFLGTMDAYDEFNIDAANSKAGSFCFSAEASSVATVTHPVTGKKYAVKISVATEGYFDDKVEGEEEDEDNYFGDDE